MPNATNISQSVSSLSSVLACCKRRAYLLGTPTSSSALTARATFLADADGGAPRAIRWRSRPGSGGDKGTDKNGARTSNVSPQSRPPACGAVLGMEGEAVLSRKNTARTCLSWHHFCLSLCFPCPCCRHEKLVALGGDAYTPGLCRESRMRPANPDDRVVVTTGLPGAATGCSSSSPSGMPRRTDSRNQSRW